METRFGDHEIRWERSIVERKVRWGFLSTALIGRKNWKAIRLSGNATIVGVASRSIDRAREFIASCQRAQPLENEPVAFGSYDALIESPEVDAVYIPLPTGLRKEWVIRAANAGKHVVCEKPCAVSAEDLEEMIQACADNGVQFMDGVMYMHTDRLAEMRKMLDDGTSIGTLKRIATQFSFCAPPEFMEDNIRTDPSLEPYGCLGDLGWYTTRLILWAMNYEMPLEVSGRLLQEFNRSGDGPGVPMEFVGDLRFANGVTATFYNSFVTQHQQWAHLSGTGGHMSVDDFVLPYYSNFLSFRVTNADFRVFECEFNMEDNTRIVTTQEYSNGMPSAAESRLFRTFSQLVLDGKVDPFWPEASLKTQKILDLCLQSARDNSRPLSPERDTV